PPAAKPRRRAPEARSAPAVTQPPKARGPVGLVQYIPEAGAAQAVSTEAARPGRATGFGLEDLPGYESRSSGLPEWSDRFVDDRQPPIPEIDESAVDAQVETRHAQLAQVVPNDAPPTPEADPDETPGQRRLRALLVRPFKKMHQIDPFYDY